jgi:hypothetical protein
MPLSKAQLMEIPGGPGVIGAILAGTGISITGDGTMSINPAQAITQIRAGSGISISPASGIGEVTVSSNAAPKETIPPGSKTIFREPSAPTGWTLSTGFDNRTIRIVNNNGGGSGGQRSFTDVFTSQGISGSFGDLNIPLSSANSSNASLTPSGSISGSMSLSGTSITDATLGFHTHQYVDWIRGPVLGLGEQNPIGVFGVQINNDFFPAMNSGAHTHSGSVSASFSGNAADHSHSTSGNFTCNTSFSGNAVNLSVQYVDVILCTKN